MDLTRRPVIGTAPTSPSSTTMQTTLYELIAALSADMGADEADGVLTATVVHFLQTHRVTWTGPLAGYRLVCAGVPAVRQEGEKARTGARGQRTSAQGR